MYSIAAPGDLLKKPTPAMQEINVKVHLQKGKSQK